MCYLLFGSPAPWSVSCASITSIVPRSQKWTFWSQFNFLWMRPHSVRWPLDVTWVGLETFFCHDLGLVSNAWEVRQFLRSSKLFWILELLKILNVFVEPTTHWWKSGKSWESCYLLKVGLLGLDDDHQRGDGSGGRPSGGFNHRLLCDQGSSWVNFLLFGQSHRS